MLPPLQAQLCRITLHCQWAKNMHLQTISRACGDLKVSVKAHRDASVLIWCIATTGCIFCIRLLQKIIMNDLPVIYLCHSCLYALKFCPHSSLLAPPTHSALMRPVLIPAGTDVVPDPERWCYLLKHQDCSIFLFLFEALCSCFSFLRYHSGISYYTSNTLKKIMKQTLSCTDLFILSQSKAVSVS